MHIECRKTCTFSIVAIGTLLQLRRSESIRFVIGL